MRPEYCTTIDNENYIYAICRCPLSANWAIKIPRETNKIKYDFICEICGTKGYVYAKEKFTNCSHLPSRQVNRSEVK